jgi:hypothetical protein
MRKKYCFKELVSVKYLSNKKSEAKIICRKSFSWEKFKVKNASGGRHF